MSQKHSGLGRNLSALLSQSSRQTSGDNPIAVEFCSITQLVPGSYQPRRVFDEEAIGELADSIRQQGLLQPIVVRALAAGQYEIIAGERRWRACQVAGLTKVPVLVRQVDNETALALALIENLQREDLTAMDQARAMQRLMVEFGLTHQQIATLLSKSRAAVSNHLRLLSLVAEVAVMLEQGQLDMGHARALLTLPETDQLQAAQLIVSKGLSVRDTEGLVARMKAGQSADNAKKSAIEYPHSIQPKLEALATRLQTAVTLKPSVAGRGTLVIHYPDLTILDQIMAQILE